MNTTKCLKNVKTVLGTMEIFRRMDLSESTKFVQAFKSYPKFVELDTAASYGGGKVGKIYVLCIEFSKLNNVKIKLILPKLKNF